MVGASPNTTDRRYSPVSPEYYSPVSPEYYSPVSHAYSPVSPAYSHGPNVMGQPRDR